MIGLEVRQKLSVEIVDSALMPQMWTRVDVKLLLSAASRRQAGRWDTSPLIQMLEVTATPWCDKSGHGFSILVRANHCKSKDD